jgi:hypothetical protein
VPLYFVWQADVYRQRWYWTDKRVSTVQRTLRLAYQPLTRRWRLSLANDGRWWPGPGCNMPCTRISTAWPMPWRWSAGCPAGGGRSTACEADDKHRVEWRFRLDLSLLPRPFQIGMANQPDGTFVRGGCGCPIPQAGT